MLKGEGTYSSDEHTLPGVMCVGNLRGAGASIRNPRTVVGMASQTKHDVAIMGRF